LRLRQANREDVIRVPARLEHLLPPDHLARRVWETVEGLDLSEFYADIEVEDGTPGAPATDPLILVAVWVYATSQGETAARRIAVLCVEHLAYIWLCGGVSLNYHTLSDFRVAHGAALDRLLTQVVRGMADDGLVGFDAHAQDGMRVRASAGAASFHRQATLAKSLAQAQAQQTALAAAAGAETQTRTAREQAAQERAAHERVERLQAALVELPAVQAVKSAEERGEARVMKMADGGFRPAYNWEFVVDSLCRVITAVDVVNAGSDKAQTLPMLEQDQQRCGRLPHDWLMDGGFVTLRVIEAAAPQVRVLAPVPEPKDETRDRYTPRPGDAPAVAAWRQRMGTDEAQETYKLRASTVECVNAHARGRYGVYQVGVRGRAKVRCVAVWVAITHNLLLWMRPRSASPAAAAAAPRVSA
jgi:transposase